MTALSPGQSAPPVRTPMRAMARILPCPSNRRVAAAMPARRLGMGLRGERRGGLQPGGGRGGADADRQPVLRADGRHLADPQLVARLELEAEALEDARR